MGIVWPAVNALSLFVWLVHTLLAFLEPVPPAARPLDVRVGSTASAVDSAGRRILLVDGKPFFPVGITYHFTRHRSTWDEDLQAMRDLGINTVRIDMGWNDLAPWLPGRYQFSALEDFLDRAARRGLYVVPVFSHTTQDLNTPPWFWLLQSGWRVVDQRGGGNAQGPAERESP